MKEFVVTAMVFIRCLNSGEQIMKDNGQQLLYN